MRSLLVLLFLVAATNAATFYLQFDDKGLKEKCGLAEYSPKGPNQGAIDFYLSKELQKFSSMITYCNQNVPSDQLVNCYQENYKLISISKNVFAPRFVPYKTEAKDFEQVFKFFPEYARLYVLTLTKLAAGDTKYAKELSLFKRAIPVYLKKSIEFISKSYQADKGAYCRKTLVCPPESETVRADVKSSTCQCYLNPSFGTPCSLTIRRKTSPQSNYGWNYVKAESPEEVYMNAATLILGASYDKANLQGASKAYWIAKVFDPVNEILKEQKDAPATHPEGRSLKEVLDSLEK